MHYSVSDVAKMLGVGSETVRRWIRDGKLLAKRVRGRNGNEITLEDVVQFANCPPLLYQDALRAWLEDHNIAYGECIMTKDGPVEAPNPVDGIGAAIGGGAAAAVGALLGGLPTWGTLAAIGATAALVEQKKIVHNQYTQLYLRTAASEKESEDSTEPQSAPPALEKASGQPEKEEVDFQERIQEEKLKLIRLRQELAELEAKISVSEKQIEYYEIMLERLNYVRNRNL